MEKEKNGSYKMQNGKLMTRMNQNYINGKIVSEKKYKAHQNKSKGLSVQKSLNKHSK